MVIFSIYTSWMLVLIYGWLISSSNNVASSGKINSLTVLIPFRNEKDNIPLLIKSLSELTVQSRSS